MCQVKHAPHIGYNNEKIKHMVQWYVNSAMCSIVFSAGSLFGHAHKGPIWLVALCWSQTVWWALFYLTGHFTEKSVDLSQRWSVTVKLWRAHFWLALFHLTGRSTQMHWKILQNAIARHINDTMHIHFYQSSLFSVQMIISEHHFHGVIYHQPTSQMRKC